MLRLQYVSFPSPFTLVPTACLRAGFAAAATFACSCIADFAVLSALLLHHNLELGMAMSSGYHNDHLAGITSQSKAYSSSSLYLHGRWSVLARPWIFFSFGCSTESRNPALKVFFRDVSSFIYLFIHSFIHVRVPLLMKTWLYYQAGRPSVR